MYNKVKKNSTVLILLFPLFLSTNIFPQDNKNSNVEEIIDSIFSQYSSVIVPGVAVIVAKEGKKLYKKCFGYANIQHKVPVTPETKFRVGSITKQFTASAIFKLQDKGLLSINDPLSNYIYDYPRGDEITIYHLLTHTSGIPNHTQKDGFWLRAKIPIEPDSLIEQFKYDVLDFSPGDNWQYSNSGYFLLGYIIEMVSGKSFADYLNENIFIPTGMMNTGYHDLFEVYENEAYGYEYSQGKIYNAELRHGSHYGAAGNLYSTVEDLYIWSEAIFNGKVLEESSLLTALFPVKWGDDEEITQGGFKYGCGWGITDHNGIISIEHGGGFNGFDNWISRYPAKNLTIVVLTNSSSFPEMGTSRKAAFKIAEVYLRDYMND